jgi:hypothetical protein
MNRLVLFRFLKTSLFQMCYKYTKLILYFKVTKLNLNLLALAYRVDQFDNEWSDIIPIE